MGCFGTHRRKNINSTDMASSKQENPESRKRRQEVLLQIPGCSVHLMEEGETAELIRNGYFTLIRLTEEDVGLATIIQIGDELQWPLTKDEPVVKLDALHYLFSLPVKDGDPLSYGVSFSEQSRNELGALDSFLKQNSCFASSSSPKTGVLDWRDFAPKVDDYNNALAKAIAGGTGQIVKGIFACSNVYAKKVQQGGEMILSQVAEKNGGGGPTKENKSNKSALKNKNGGLEKNLKRVRKVSKTTEKMSKALLDGITVTTGSIAGPLVRSQAGKGFLNMVPGEVLLASLDALNQVLDAVEAAERQALSATSATATRVVTQRYGEGAGEVTKDVFATAGHCAGTAWNIFKIRKAINPASSVPSAIMKNAVKNNRK